MNEISRIFVDTSKSVFQLHGVDAQEGPVLRRQLKRSGFLEFFAKLGPTVVGLEACGASHHWARELRKLGHEVVLIAPQHVQRTVKRGKNDARDAEAGCEAMSRPHMDFVPVKTVEEQADLMLMSVREGLVTQRTRLANTIRGHAAEFGHTVGLGLDKIAGLVAGLAADEALPARARRMFALLADEFR